MTVIKTIAAALLATALLLSSPARASDAAVEERVHAQVAARLTAVDRAERRQVARVILSEAARAGIDPLLVVAVIHVESSFNPRAESSAGAIGLMQLRLTTLQGELKRSRLPPGDPRDPSLSVRAGVRYLKRLLDAFGDVDVALMAYNAGPNRILRYLRQGGIPDRFHVYPRKVRSELARILEAPVDVRLAAVERRGGTAAD